MISKQVCKREQLCSRRSELASQALAVLYIKHQHDTVNFRLCAMRGAATESQQNKFGRTCESPATSVTTSTEQEPVVCSFPTYTSQRCYTEGAATAPTCE